jgi:hypothetical protein
MISKSEFLFDLIYERIYHFLQIVKMNNYFEQKEIILSQNNVHRILRIFRLSSSVKFLVFTTALCSSFCNFIIGLTFRQSSQTVIISN